MQTLAVVPSAGHLVFLPAGIDHRMAHAQLSALLAQAAGPDAAGLFAEPRPTASGLEFAVPDGQVARFDELDAEGRTALRAELGRLVSLLRRAAQSAARRDPARYGAWPELVATAIEVPSFELVHAREGRPVLAGWGLVPASAPSGLGLIRVLDDGQAAAPAVAFPVWAAALSCLVLMAIGAMAAFAAPHLIPLFGPVEAVCRVAPGDQQAFLELDNEKKREQDLRRRLASLQQGFGEKRAVCPIPQLPPPPQRAQAPALPPPAEPKPEASPPTPTLPPPPEPKAEVSPPTPKPPPPAPRQQPPPQPPPNTEPCNVERKSGGAGITDTKHYLGPQPGRVRLMYNNRSEPDRIVVSYKGRVLAQTRGFTPHRGGIEFDWNPTATGSPNDYVVTVEVTGNPGSRSTVWSYNLACPAR